ncbi:hypothetical protein, unlikely [Trypanosoma brucei gambiense DAL972]|uniref:Uncharacterized protein n=1 Tax=Trypanosoma brucei gambiense (strain MHOM/CI/86/DAL972) TaxID=679716 RepID=D0A1G2_TRYB9|nr:hypothetical protein, unlikely [Trypanosoma brucei gambiense DAL972]CBH15104.1 hypothetical protein, unlikely [Trypanosoma brucei gambiense DAL972]|eukprot:XP_011777370.1 hypothetical protein, unlikely [Trypanosoma brucei gambiense DAL972]
MRMWLKLPFLAPRISPPPYTHTRDHESDSHKYESTCKKGWEKQDKTISQNKKSRGRECPIVKILHTEMAYACARVQLVHIVFLSSPSSDYLLFPSLASTSHEQFPFTLCCTSILIRLRCR